MGGVVNEELTLIPISYVALIFSPQPPMIPQRKPLPSISYFASSPCPHSRPYYFFV